MGKFDICQKHHNLWFKTFVLNKKKEVIQPQVPLRLPCDDLTLLAKLRFDIIKK